MKSNPSSSLSSELFGIDLAVLKIFLIPGSIVFVFLILTIGVLLPKVGEVQDMLNQITSIKSQASQIKEKTNYLLAVDQDQLKASESLLSSSIMRQRDSFYLVNVIRLISDKYGFQVDSFKINQGQIGKDDAPATKLETVSKIPVHLSLIGTEATYLPMITEIEKSLPILSIDNLDMKKMGDNVTVNMTVSSYFIAQNNNFNVNNLTLNDLKLSNEEMGLLTKLNSFSKVADVTGFGDDIKQKQFTKYDRTNPFSL